MNTLALGIIALFLIAIVILILAFWRVITGAEDEITEANQEITRLQGDIDSKRDLFDQIVALDTPKAAHGVKKAVALAKAGQAK